MQEMVLKTKAIPEPLYQLFAVDEVIAQKQDDEIMLIPAKMTRKITSNCPFLGYYSDGQLTLDGYLSRKRKDMELER